MPTTHKEIIFLLITSAILVALAGLPLGKSLGLIDYGRTDYVTVTGIGYAKGDNRLATYTAGVTSINADKQQAVTEMNERSGEVVEAIKNFGIPEEDLKTSNYSIYQDQTWDNETARTVLGDWRATTSIEITLRDVTKAEELSDLLASLRLDNIYGPNFRVDSSAKDSEDELLANALNDAREKAQSIAELSGRKLGKMTNFVEGSSAGTVSPMFLREGMGGAGGAADFPGTTELSKAVTVTYILR